MASNEFSVEITIHCPVCNTRGQISVEKNIIDQSSRGVTAVNVAENLICQHSFVTYVDKNLNVRDAFVCDFKVEIPKLEGPDLEEYESPTNFDLSIIKINIMPSVMANILRAILMGAKIVYLSDQEFLDDHFYKFLEYIFGDSFNIDLIFVPLGGYKKNAKQYRNNVVFKDKKIIRDPNKIFEQSSLKIELAIVQQFYREYDEISCLILFKNEINKIERLIHQILKYHESQKEGQEFKTKEAIEHLNNQYKTTIPLSYLNFLLDIIESYFEIKLNRATKMADFMGLI